MTRALFLDSKVPKVFWPEAIATSVYLMNCLPTRILDLKTPLDILSKLTNIPEPLTLPPKIFGCTVYVHIPKHERTKFSSCAVKCVFMGYGMNQKGYRCFDPVSRKIITTMNCNFLETEYFYHNHLSGQGEMGSEQDPLRWWSVPTLSRSSEEPTEEVNAAAEHVPHTNEIPQQSPPNSSPDVISEVNSEPPPNDDTTDNPNVQSQEVEEEITAIDGDTGRYVLPPRSTRGIPPKRYSPEKVSTKNRYSIANFAKVNLTKMARAFQEALYEEEEIPHTAEEAWKIPHWRKAMLVEMKVLKKNNTWEKSQLPEGSSTVGCRWVFTIKKRPGGSIERYKARLVAKGTLGPTELIMQRHSPQLPK